MNFVLYYKHGPELVQIEDSPRVITSVHDWKPKDKHWTYVNDEREATLFTSEVLAELARDHFCRLPEIGYKPI